MTLIIANSTQPRRLTRDPPSRATSRCRLPGRRAWPWPWAPPGATRRHRARRYPQTPIGPTVTQTAGPGEDAGVAAGDGEGDGRAAGPGPGAGRWAVARGTARRAFRSSVPRGRGMRLARPGGVTASRAG